jgi:pimeloyl-ACP methyl ester carboxylesterase
MAAVVEGSEAVAASQAASLQRHTVTVEGHAIAVHSKRPARPRAAVLLIHGRTWSGLPDFDLQVAGEQVSLMDALVAADVAAYAVDLRGYGATPRDATGFLTPTRAVADVAEVLRFVATDAGAPGKPFLFGWSLGALVSALTVQTRPELAAGVVLYGYPCRAGPPSAATPDPERPRRAANTAESARSDFITPNSVSQAVVDGFVAAALKADPVRADWRSGGEWDQIAFDRLRVPVLVIHGEHDPVTDRGCMAGRFAALQAIDRRWQIVAGADHAAHLERSGGRFIAAVVDFLVGE